MARKTGGGKSAAKKSKSKRTPSKKAEAQANGSDGQSQVGGGGVQVGPLPIFYSQPEMLDAERHAGLELRDVDSYEFTRNVNAIPVTANEFPIAARDYPIVFTKGDSPGAIAIVGLRNEENLMLDKEGGWAKGTYIPAYVRRYPFIFLRSIDGNRFALCIDRASSRVAEGKKTPLFEDKEMGQAAKDAMEFCRLFQQQHLITERVVEVLQTHDLLIENQGRFRLQDGRTIAVTDFMVVDEKKFNDLSDKAFLEIRKSGALPAIYCHLVSINAWPRLVDRFATVVPKS